MMENTDKDAILDILKEECLDDDKRINDFFDTSLKTIHPSQVDRVLKKLNIHHYGYQYKKDTIPLEKLYDTYLQNIDEFSPSLKEKLEGTIFQTFTNKKYDTSDEKLGRMINYSIGRLEAMYYNIDNYFKYELTLEALEKVLNNDKNDLTVEARKLLRERYIEGITIKELAKKYGVSYIKMHDDLRKHYDHAIALSFNKSVKLVITDEERYKKYILDKRYPIASTSRDVCYLFFIKHKNYKEIAEILNIDNTAKVSNFLTEAIRKMDFWYYGIIKENVFPLDKVNEVLNNIEYDSLTVNIIKESFINGLANDEIAQKLGVDLDTVDFATSEFITQYNDYHSRIDLSMDDIIKEINLPLCDSVLTNSEREFLSFYFGIKNAYNPEKKIDRASSETNDVEEYKEQLLTKVREHICGLLIPDFSIYSQAEIKEILNNPLIPISDYEKDLLRDIKGLDGFFYTQTELAKKYNVTKAYSIGRRINRALLTIKKYEAGEIEGKIDYDVHVVPLLKYFPLFEQKILYKRFKEKKTAKQIGKMYKLTETQSLDLVGKIEKRFYYLLKFPNAKKFDFDYARMVLHNDDLPFYGDKAKAIHLYERLFGDDGEFPQIKEELLDELNITKNAPTSLHIKYLMIAVMKYKDGIKKNKTFTKEEIEDFYTRNKDQYNELEQNTFEKTLNKFADAVNFPIIDVYNEFVTYELLKEREKELFYNKETPKDTIRNIILNNPCNLSHSQLEVLRNYFKLTKRDLLSGKEKIKLIKLLYPALIEYDLKIQKKHKKNSIDEINLARQIDTEGIEVKEDLDNNVKYIVPYIITPQEFENNKVLVATEDLDYVFAYIYNYIKSIDVLKRNELLERLYALKAYILNNLDRFVYQDVFKNGLNSKNMEKLKNMPPELKAFFTELMRLKNCNIKQDIADTPSTYLRKTLMSNEKYFRRVQIRGKDAEVNFINSLNDYYKEINLGRITKDNYQELTKRVIDAYKEYLVYEGSLISYFSNDDIELIEELFGDIDHEEIDIRGISYDKEPVGKLVRVKRTFDKNRLIC